MGRTRQFDSQAVLSAARAAFWEHGVAATSIRSLSEATGLTVGSLYKAWDHKQALLLDTLDDYLEHALVATVASLESHESPRAGIECWLAAMAERASEDSATCGCFGVQCATELASTDVAIRQRLQTHDAAIEQLLSEVLQQAAELGELRCADPSAAARFLLTVVCGLQVQARKGISRAEADDLLALALSMFVPTPS